MPQRPQQPRPHSRLPAPCLCNRFHRFAILSILKIMPRRHRDDSAASRKYHNRVARQYDQIYDDRYWEFHDELTWRSIKPHLPKSTTSPCLDLGCGTGKWGIKLLKSGFPTTFIDHSPAMVDQARAKVEALGPRAKHASFLVADIIDLHELPDNHFALAV